MKASGYVNNAAVAAPKSDPVFLQVKAGMTVIVTDTDSAWRIAEMSWVDSCTRNDRHPILVQAADLHTEFANEIN